jgi:lipopolysaccharide transport system ATP-binding protein
MNGSDHPLVIRVEGVSKRYRLGQADGATLSEDIGAWIASLRGKPDPRVAIGKEVDSQRIGSDFWALRDVSFDVHQGETLGIIGRNGAGKSTLLKLLSRITLPTDGEIRMKGRMSSLLEVGTGFNPELTGRENIFLNGAILGMRTAEIGKKLDDIIAFSGIQHHIDSPVKRYSSGMKVRLGFSVAAHLEPEILVVDEVLAVGDAEFQRKCLGKMKDVSRSGRTILFVSHNMTAIASLCSRVIWLNGGRIQQDGDSDAVVKAYLRTYGEHGERRSWSEADMPGNDLVRLTEITLDRGGSTEPLSVVDPFRILVHFRNSGITDNDLNISLHIYNGEDILAFTTSWHEGVPEGRAVPLGEQSVWCAVPADLLNSGDYRVVVNFFRAGKLLFQVEDTISFEVHDVEREGAWYGRRKGVFRPLLKWGSAA